MRSCAAEQTGACRGFEALAKGALAVATRRGATPAIAGLPARAAAALAVAIRRRQGYEAGALATAGAADYGRRMNPEAAPEFDTLAVARKLEAAGVDREQAEAHTEALRDSRAGSVTKAYFDVALEAALARQDRRTLLVGLSIAALLFAAMKSL